MTLQKLIRYSGYDLLIAGILTAAFWLLSIPFETFAGAEVVNHPLYAPGQAVHTFAALFMVFGYTGLYLKHLDSGWFGMLAYGLAVIGAIFFFGDAVIAISVFPVLADAAPQLLTATGPFFTGWVLTLYVIFFATHMIGIILFGVVIWINGDMPRAAIVLFIVGGILFNLPAAPVLHIPHIIGGVLYGIGCGWMGIQLTKS